MIQEILGWYFGLFGFSIITGILLCLFAIFVDLIWSVIKIVLLIISRLKSLGNKIECKTYPSISIIIPAHNEEDCIEGSILSYLESRYPDEKKEIIVVDDASTDKTYQKALPYAKKGLIKLYRKTGKSGFKSSPLNYGIAMAKNDIIISLDADTRLDVTSLYEITRPFGDDRVMAVAGNVKVKNTKSLLERFQEYEYTFSMQLGKRIQALLGTILIVPGCFGAYKKEYIKTVGSYDRSSITEDFDLSLKVKKRQRIEYAPNALAWTIAPNTWGSWIRQRIRWSRGEIDTFIKHKNIFFNPYFGLAGVIAAPGMFFSDVFLLIIRLIYFIALFLVVFIWKGFDQFFNVFEVYLRVLVMNLGIYLFIELISVVAILSQPTIKRDLPNILLAPLIVVIYRSIYGVVRLKGYYDYFRKKAMEW